MPNLILQILIMLRDFLLFTVNLFFYGVKTVDLKIKLTFLGHFLDLIVKKKLSILMLDYICGFGP